MAKNPLIEPSSAPRVKHEKGYDARKTHLLHRFVGKQKNKGHPCRKPAPDERLPRPARPQVARNPSGQLVQEGLLSLTGPEGLQLDRRVVRHFVLCLRHLLRVLHLVRLVVRHREGEEPWWPVQSPFVQEETEAGVGMEGECREGGEDPMDFREDAPIVRLLK